MLINELRTAGLRDVPLLRRLTDTGAILDSELAFTRDVNDGFTLPNVLLPQRGVYTLLARSHTSHVMGQFRQSGDNVQVTILAPRLLPDVEDTLWLHVLDGLAQEAGKRSAHALVAEVDELSPLFETMRVAGFAVYARQEIWRLMPEDNSAADDGVELEDASAGNPQIHALRCAVTPKIMQPLMETDGEGWCYRRDGRCEAYIDVSRGKQGVMLEPNISPGVDAQRILMAALARAGKAELPVYVRVRRYHLWLEDTLAALDFEPVAQQAVMVRHVAAGVRFPAFANPRSAFDASAVPANGLDTFLGEPA